MKIKNKYPNIVIFLKQIYTSYKRYLGDKSLNLLRYYLAGFGHALDFHETEDWGMPFTVEEVGCFNLIFQRKIEEKYKCLLTVSFYDILRFYSDSEEEAFELFYKELDTLCEEDVATCALAETENDSAEVMEVCGKIRIFGDDIEASPLKKELYNERFYQELWKILIMIKRGPALMIGEKSLTRINAYINGFAYAYHLADQSGSTYGIFPGFEEWVNQKARLHVNRPWYKTIEFKCFNEEDAFNLFYNYLEEYVEEIR